MEEETKRLMVIATTDNDPDTRKKAGECVVFDLEKAGEFDQLWQMQFDRRLEREVGIAAGLAAADGLARDGKTMKLMHIRRDSPFPEVKLEIRLHLEKAGLVDGWKAELFRRRMKHLRGPAPQPPRGEIARA
ncbi:MAG: hypothetical protein PHY95_02480 [Candidatus ainarchaeum sp.]|nr:hypothetical protein [Candidatus ainarchaeum sp.]